MKIPRVLLCAGLLLAGLLSLLSPVVVAAIEPVKEGEERLSVDTKFPKVPGEPGKSFSWAVEIGYITYLGSGEPRFFNLILKAPINWDIYMVEQNAPDTKISVVKLDPGSALPITVIVTATSPIGEIEPGNYIITLDINSVSGEPQLTHTEELTAIVTPTHLFFMIPDTTAYTTKIRPGEANRYPIDVSNLGTASVTDITFTTKQPEGWSIKFSPEKIDSISIFETKAVDVTIEPPSGTPSGDYHITINASSPQVTAAPLEAYLTVESSSIWPSVAVGAIGVFLAGVLFVFFQLGKR